jgi:DNA-binding response OmpR family regulator
MISAKEDINSKLNALDMGADDYLVKPFEDHLDKVSC